MTGQLPHYGRELREFMDLPDDLFDAVCNMYRHDFEMYGYGYKRQKGSVITRCEVDDGDDGVCC